MAQGVVVGASHPVMQLTGQLPADSAFLLEAAPPGNVLISARACATLVDDERARLVEVAKCRGGMTFLLDHPELPLQIDYVRQQIARCGTHQRFTCDAVADLATIDLPDSPWAVARRAGSAPCRAWWPRRPSACCRRSARSWSSCVWPRRPSRTCTSAPRAPPTA